MSNEDTRDTKELLLKKKLGEEDIDLSTITDEDLDSLVTNKDKEEYIKATADSPDLNLESLPDEQVDSLLGSLDPEKKEASLSEKVVVSRCFKESEARNIHKYCMRGKRSFINNLYETFMKADGDFDKIDLSSIMKKSDLTPAIAGLVDPQKDLEDQKGEKIGKTPEKPEVIYANMEDAKHIPDPIDISEKDSRRS